MDDPGHMGRLQRAGHLGADLGHPPDRQRPRVAHQVGQGRRVDQLHHDEGAAMVGDDVIERDRARVVEPGRRPRLPHHPRLGRAPLLVGHGGREHHFLDRHLATQHRVPGTPDDAHPSPPEESPEHITIGDDAVGGWLCHLARLPISEGRNRAAAPNPSGPRQDKQQTSQG